MRTLMKAQKGKSVKKKTPHPNDDYKNMKDPATGKKGTVGGEGTNPPFTREERKKMPKVNNMGSGKNGKSIKKAQVGGKIKGNPEGYNPKTSPLPNTINKGGYEKKMDTIGKGTTRSVRLLDGKGKLLGQERLGSVGAEKLSKRFKTEKSYTDKRRNLNRSFLEDKKALGEAASKSSSKKTMRSGGKMTKCKYGCK
jgi:hypothetical protein